MMTAHPNGAELDDFVVGKLGSPDYERVESHISECEACQTRAAGSVSDDTFVSLLVAARQKVEAYRADSPTATMHGHDATPAEFAPTRAYDGPASPMRPVAPPELADHPRYRLGRLLGSGGMGTVWLAEHAVMGRPVALKVIRPEFLARAGAVERFRREVRAAAQLNHPNIATAFDADEANGLHFLVMEYVPGETLVDVLKRGPLPVAEACRAVRDAARALAHAHASGLIHRDMKPGNLIRAADGTTKVLDFGLVGMEAEEPGLTGENMVMGTPDYIAPEQAVDARTADARSDIYSLGCTLYHLLSGRVPYPSDATMKKLDAHRDPGRAPETVPGLSPKLATVLARTMEKNPADRYQTAEEVANALERFCVTVEVEPRLAKPRGRSRWAIAAGMLLVLLAVAAAGVVYKIQRDNEVITIETDDPDIEVVMKRNGELVRIVDAKTKQSWDLDAKKLRLTPDGSELSIDLPGKEPLVIRRNGDVAAVIRREAVNTKPIAVKASLPGPRSVTDFREVHGASIADLRTWCNRLPAGFFSVCVTAQGATTTPLFDAVAVRDGRSVKFEVHFELGNHNKQTDFDSMSRAGWSLKGACTYPADGKILRHHVWITDDRECLARRRDPTRRVAGSRGPLEAIRITAQEHLAE